MKNIIQAWIWWLLTFLFVTSPIFTEPEKQDRNVPSLDPLTSWLIQKKIENPLFFQYSAFVLNSRSLQASSDYFPRIISTIENDERLITFNTNPSDHGFELIEQIVNKGHESLPKFHKDRYLNFAEISLGQAGRLHTYSDQNTTDRCARCHGIPLKPIWEPYDQWPGTLGSLDDVIADVDSMPSHEKESFIRRTFVNSGLSMDENSIVSQLNLMKKEYGIWKYLKKLNDDSQISFGPYPRLQLFNFNGPSPVHPFTPESRNGPNTQRPNLRMTMNLARINADKIYRMMRDTGSCFAPARDLYIATIFNCEQQGEERSTISLLLNRLKTLYPNFEKIGYWNEYHKIHKDINYSTYEHAIRTMSFLGIEKEDWSLKQYPKYWTFHTGPDDFSIFMAANLVRKDYPQHAPTTRQTEYYDLVNDIYSYQNFDTTGLCAALDANLNNTLAKEPELLTKPCPNRWGADASAELEQNQIIRMCSSCHSNEKESEAPLINFESLRASQKTLSQKNELIRRINLPHEDPQHMPPGRNLTNREKNALENYLGFEHRDLNRPK